MKIEKKDIQDYYELENADQLLAVSDPIRYKNDTLFTRKIHDRSPTCPETKYVPDLGLIII